MRVGLLALIIVGLALPGVALAEAMPGRAPALLVAEASTGCGPGGNFEGEDKPECSRPKKCFFGVICPRQPGGPDGPFYQDPAFDQILKDIMTRSNETAI